MNKIEFAAITALEEIYSEVDNTFAVLQLMLDAFDDDMSNLPEDNLFAARAPIYQSTLSVIMNQLHHILEEVAAGKDMVSSVSKELPPSKPSDKI